jgi:hypothetical protein
MAFGEISSWQAGVAFSLREGLRLLWGAFGVFLGEARALREILGEAEAHCGTKLPEVNLMPRRHKRRLARILSDRQAPGFSGAIG